MDSNQPFGALGNDGGGAGGPSDGQLLQYQKDQMKGEPTARDRIPSLSSIRDPVFISLTTVNIVLQSKTTFSC
jgi:hypothetical protein